jgi:glycerophosphoryl diester phosphodiesterase
MKLIAHGIKNLEETRSALKSGADFVEVDVAKRIIFSKFTTQHHGIKGKFGIGENLESILSAIPSNKLLLDIKHAASSLTFTRKLSDLLIAHNIKNARICGLDWQIISAVCEKTGCLPYYTIREIRDIGELEIILPKLTKPAGFSIRHDLIDKELVRHLRSDYPTSELFAWTVNDLTEAKRLKELKVNGIITDEWNFLKK